MTSPSQRIEEELKQLEEAIAQVVTELENTYVNYLNGLGQALRQQLIHAAYHLCTQVYPAEFLKLSFSQREKLQQALIKMAIATQQEFLGLLSVDLSKEKENLDDLFDEDEDDDDEDQDNDHENNDLAEEFLSVTEETINHSEHNDPADFCKEEAPTEKPKFGKFNNLGQLIKWQKQTEKAIAKILTNLSIQANHLLYKNRVLPNHLPERLVERAVRMEPNESAIAGIPHLLNIVVEMERDEDDEDKQVTRLVAIYLRLSEIEFNDKTMNASRLCQQIKNISGKLQTMAQDQEKKQRKLSTIQAEDAWRASWYDG
ncbi:MAG: hypothetical protein ACRC2J_07545 [Microcoleaceae cyanobacterium]